VASEEKEGDGEEREGKKREGTNKIMQKIKSTLLDDLGH
jgi:hypothetical protein